MSDERRDEFVVEQLAELRRAVSGLEAPARVEPAVMAAFRKTTRRPRFGMVWRFAAVAAGVAVLVLAWQWRTRTHGTVQKMPELAVQKSLDPQRPKSGIGNIATSQGSSAEQKIARSVPEVKPLANARGSQRSTVAKRKPLANARGSLRSSQEEDPAEIATEFLALPYAPPLDPADGGQVVRVRLPRAAMRAVGIPINEDRWHEQVPADVVLGQDGVARAVRFVKVAQ